MLKDSLVNLSLLEKMVFGVFKESTSKEIAKDLKEVAIYKDTFENYVNCFKKLGSDMQKEIKKYLGPAFMKKYKENFK